MSSLAPSSSESKNLFAIKMGKGSLKNKTPKKTFSNLSHFFPVILLMTFAYIKSKNAWIHG